MVDNEAPASAAASSNATLEPKRVRTSSPDKLTGDSPSPSQPSSPTNESQAPEITTTASAIPTEPLPEDGEIEAVSKLQQRTDCPLTRSSGRCFRG